ncbi:hypothetical protein LBMAG42_34650 [Deltaproteobacteria bacterium]|nr:hypothetical protein LBMAG42_34650 [Deltaproteobacteria bacterium]
MLAPRVLAALLPASLLLLVVVYAGQPAAPAEDDALARVRAELDRNGADIVLLGNSTSHSDLDRRRVAEALDVPRISNPAVAGSAAAAWLAVLERRIVGEGLTPRLVMVFGTLETHLGWLPSGVRLDRLESVVGDDASIVSERVLGRGKRGVWERALAARGGIHSSLVDGLRNRTLGLVLGGEGDTLAAKGASRAAPALQSLFGETAHLRTTGAARVLPVAEREAAGAFASTKPVNESLVPHLVAVAHGAGARIVFVRGPDGPGREPGPTLEAEAEPLRLLLDRLGAGYADLSYLRLPPSVYRDSVHLNSVGQEAVTDALEAELDRLHPLAPEPMPRSRPPVLALDARRVGAATLPTLSAERSEGSCRWSAAIPELAPVSDAALLARGLGPVSPLLLRVGDQRTPPHTSPAHFPEDCGVAAYLRAANLLFSADTPDRTAADFELELDPALPQNPGTDEETWWVYPDTTVRFSVAASGPVRVRAALRALGDSQVAVSVDGRPMPLDAVDERRDGALSVEGRTEPWLIEVSSRGGYAVIESLDVGEPGRERALAGSYAARVGLWLGWRGQPVAVAAGAPRLENDRRVVETPSLASVGDERLAERGIQRCSVLEVRQGGQLLDHALRPRAATATERGRARFAGPIVELPLGEGAVELALSGARKCESASWVYPGEAQERATTGVRLGRLRSGASALELVATAFGGGSSMLRVTLSTPKETLLEAEVPLAALAGEPVLLPMARRVVGRLGSVTLRVENTSAEGFVLVQSAAMFDDTAL